MRSARILRASAGVTFGSNEGVTEVEIRPLAKLLASKPSAKLLGQRHFWYGRVRLRSGDD